MTIWCKKCALEILTGTQTALPVQGGRHLNYHVGCEPPKAEKAWSLTSAKVRLPTIRGPLPTTVGCEPYKARVTIHGCTARYLIANSGDGYQHPAERARFAMKDRHSLCKGCWVGKVRAKSLDAKVTPEDGT